MTRADIAGPPVSRGKEEKGYQFGSAVMLGHGLLLLLGRMVYPGPFIFFSSFPSFLFILFSLIFLSFALWLQIDSNLFVKISKIQHNNLRQ
jgi:hypothetical protein